MNGSPAPVHVPVLASRCVDLFSPALGAAPEPVIIDATLGLGGHSRLLLEEFADVHVIGIDRDPQALEIARQRLARFGDRFTGVHATYDEIAHVAQEHAPGAVVGVLMDLGVSSMQLDEAGRGFAYSQDGPLDMRMDQTQGRTAADLLAELPEAELRRILRVYGEEKFAPRIAAEIVARRASAPVRTSAELADLVRACIPAPARRTGGNPSKRTFQALRVAVNEELEILARAVPAALEALTVGGRLVVMSYQSLEDRIIKRAFTSGATSSAPPGFPVELPEQAPYLKSLTKGAERASEEEILSNPRSAPVRLRAVELIRDIPKERK